MSKIKIIHVISALNVGGAEALLFDLVKNINKEKFDIKILCFFKQGGLVNKFIDAGFDITFLEDNRGSYFKLFPKIVNFFKSENPDIVHTHLFGADFFGVFAAKYVGVKNIVSTEHNLNKGEGYVKNICKFISIRFVNKIIAISNAVKKYINKYYFVFGKNIKVINNFVEIEKWNCDYNVLINNKIKIAVIGRLVEQKGHYVLINALSKVDFDFELILIGDGEKREELESLVNELNLQSKISFLGSCNNVPELIKDVDVIVQPSLWEGFGITVVEALAASKLVVASKVDGILDIIEDRKNGLFFDVGNIEDLVGRLNWVNKNRMEAICIAKNAKESVLKFDVKNVMFDYEMIYEEMVETNN